MSIGLKDKFMLVEKYLEPHSLRVQIESAQGMSLQQEAKLMRKSIVETLHQQGGGHYGGSLSVADAVLVLYRRCLRIDPNQPRHPERDRLILSKGHAAMALFSMLNRLGITRDTPMDFESVNEEILSHPDMTCWPGIDFSTGSLGQGLSVGLGMAVAAPASTIWVILGDGECQEGQIWEAAMFAARLNIGNLKVIVDCNGFQEFGQQYSPYKTDHRPVPLLAEKWSSFGWFVIECNGNDIPDIEKATREANREASFPVVILAQTKKGFGSALIEADPYRFHCGTLNEEEYIQVIEELT
jgi:transketolase